MAAVLRALLLLFSASVSEAAGLPGACDPREDAVVCELQVQRNDAMDKLAVAQGTLRKQAETAQRLADWWAAWVEGDLEKAAWWDRVWSYLPFRSGTK